MPATSTTAAATFPARSLRRAIIGGLAYAAIALTMAATLPPLTLNAAEQAPAPLPSCASCAWTVADVDALIAEIAQAEGEGLDPVAYDAAGLRSIAERSGQSAALDAAAESAALTLAHHYLLGRVADRARQGWTIARTDDDPAALAAGLHAALGEARLRPWLRSLLPGDARYVALRTAYAATPADSADHVRIRTNLERWRWMPRELGADHIYVNVPSYTLAVVDGGVPVSAYDVVVGAPATPTPQMSALARTVVVNPSWHVPASIVRSSRMQAGKPGFILTTLGNGTVAFSQPPGPGNALGRIKIDMPNPNAIYLHDTPAKALFQRTSRAFSHGCIRVKDIARLAAELVELDEGSPRQVAAAMTGYRTTPVRLQTARPVYIVYFTADADQSGAVTTYGDPYGYDSRVLAGLDGKPVQMASN